MSEEKENIVIKFAGDSGDGMQLTGTQFTNNTALYGNDFTTFPNYPAEIRAPQGTIHGVSGFQINFGSYDIHSPGDEYDVLVAMNAAAIKDSLKSLKKGGIVIADKAGFDTKNLRLAGYNPNENLLENDVFAPYKLITLDITEQTILALENIDIEPKEKLRSKNMFVLGLLLWIYNRDLDSVLNFIDKKFKNNIKEANEIALKSGYYYGETAELFAFKTTIKPIEKEKGVYRNIMGNQATAYGLMAAAANANLPLFYGSYPITPASDILHELSKHTKEGGNVSCFQAEDEIAAVSAAIGASFGGALGTTGTSGPGLALKSEAINLDLMLELPLVVVDVQRAGPSTGMPTKTEQSDLLFAMYGRNGDSPLPIISAHSPSNCFQQVYWASKIAVEYMTPVIFLSDGYLANGSEPWKIQQLEDLPKINLQKNVEQDENTFLPYKRNENLVRDWVVPGTEGKAHRIGGLEKEYNTGNVSYVPENHQLMTDIRQQKVANVQKILPKQELNSGVDKG
ncbi:MAG: 2-oxoacid:acceptor oxidoreductase subunit alpha, partial [Bacteroidetes bacterium]|nr:2-oxoacid:acceptor oxidoreductase subunit alpha [Bacteroidota bacterium]